MAAYILPGYLLGQRIWLLPLAVGLVLAFRDRRRWGFALLYGIIILASLLPLAWLPRHFTSLVPFIAGLTALGLVRIVGYLNRFGPRLRRPVLAFVLIACAACLWFKWTEPGAAHPIHLRRSSRRLGPTDPG